VPSFKVQEIVGQRPWPNAEDTKVIYFNFRAEGIEKVCNIGRKPGNELKVGDVLEASAEEDDRGGLKLKVQNNFSGGGGGGPKQTHPTDAKRMGRAHAQEMALRYCLIQQQRGKLPPDFSINDLKKIIEWFEKDVEAAAA
jgi:hypothetical protein